MVKTEVEYVKKNNKELETNRTLSRTDEDWDAEDDSLGGSIVDGSKNDSRCSYKGNGTGDEFSKVRKRLPFEEDGRFSKKMATSTPGFSQTPFSGVIDISDEDVNYDETPEYKNSSDSSNRAAFSKSQTPFSGVIDISDEDVNYDKTPECKNISDSSNRAAFSKTQTTFSGVIDINDEDVNYDEIPEYKNISDSTNRAARNKTQTPFSGVIDISDEDVNYDETPKHKNISDSRNHAAFNKTHTQFSGVIDISDEDVKYDETPEYKNMSDSSNHAAFNKTNLEDFDDLKFRCSNSKSVKRKRAANIFPSDNETKKDSEDEVTEGARKRCLSRLRKLGSKNKQDTSGVNQKKKTVVIDLYNSSDEDDIEGSESEDSLSDFINDSPEMFSESESASESSDSIEEPENVLNDYKETIENIRRKKVSNFKWHFQGEMQADFGKDPELCMRAVCALYRRQTGDEQVSNRTIHDNDQGFNKPDANKASDIAQFLMDGDSKGDLNKTVGELLRYNRKGIKLCRSLALKYSRQLFEIYKSNEDPYFPPR